MRALVLSELFSPTRGGTAVWFDQVYRCAEAAGSAIVAADVAGAANVDRDYPRRVHRLSWKRHAWMRPESAAIYLSLLRRTIALAAGGEFEAVHAGRVLPEGLVAVVAGRLTGLPALIYAHGEEITGWREPLKRRVMRWVYTRGDAVIANSDFTRRLLITLGVRDDRIATIYPGVDAQRFAPHVDGHPIRKALGIGKAPLILSVGRLQRRKGFDHVIEALPSVIREFPTVHYAIIGTGVEDRRLRRLAFEHNVADRVHFIGHVTDDELPAWYAACDLFAMPNRDVEFDSEGFGMVYLEASASGKCVLAGRDGGTGSAVLDGVTGMRVRGWDVRAVAEGLFRLLRRRELADEMGRLGRERVCRELTWQAVSRRTSQLHASLIAGKPSPRDAGAGVGKPALGEGVT